MMTPVELNQKAFQVLIDGLGYADAIRYLKQFDNGSGNYTQDRHQWLDPLSLEDIWTDIQQRQSVHATPDPENPKAN
jgi:hypothetical protein